MSEAAALGERQQVLDDGWLLMLLAAALAVGIPWFLRNSQIELAPVAWAAFVYGSAYFALSRATERLRGARSRLAAATALQALSVLFVAYLWHHAGNVQNPMFLMVFAIPVAAGGCVLPGTRAVGLALLAAASATFVAIASAPQLRWYLGQLGIPVEWVPTALASSGARPFPGLDLPAAYLFLLLITFTVVILAVALLSESVSALLRGLQARLEASTREHMQADTLATVVIHAAPHPTVLVYADTFRVARASRSFLERAGILPETLEQASFFDCLELAHPEVIRELAAGAGGVIPVAIYSAAGSTHVARVHVTPLEHGGGRYACLVLEDVLDQLALRAALDEAAEGLVVIGAEQRVHSFNAAAHGMLPQLRAGLEASVALDGPDAASAWWVLGPRSQRARVVALQGKSYSAKCSALAIPGLQERLTIVRLSPSA